MRENLPRFVIITFLAMLLSACGGGGGGGLASGGTETTEETVPTLTLSILDESGVATSEVNGNTPVTVRAVLVDGNGDAVVGQVIIFTTAVGTLSPATGNALTGAGGIAEITLSAGTVADAGVVSASASIDENTITSNQVGIESDGGETDTGSLTLVVTFALTTPDDSITVSRDNAGTGTVTVTDGDGDPVDQAIVQFATTAGELDPSSGVISTDSSGIATVALLAGTTAESGIFSASVTSGSETVEANSINFITEGDAVATIELSVLGATTSAPPSIPTAAVVDGAVLISNASPETIIATVIDSTGSLVQGSIVTFTNTGEGELSVTTDITNASGQAQANLLPGTVAGFGEITASTVLDGTTISTPSDGSIIFTTDGDGPFDGEGTSNLSISITMLDGAGAAFSGPVDAENPAILQATVLDATGAALSDIVVEFSAEIGDLFPVNGLGLTDSSGMATAALNAGSVPGAGLATATLLIDGARFNAASLTFETLGNAGDAVLAVTLTFTDATPGNSSNIITKADDATIGILVEEEEVGGLNLPNRSATITTTLGTVSISGGTAASAVTAVTDSDGRISVLLEAGDDFGTGDVVVTVGDTSETVQFDVGVAGLQIGICSGGTDAFDCGAGTTFNEGEIDVGTDPLSAGGTSSVSLMVLDADNDPVPDIDIAFTTNCADTLDDDTGLPLASISSTLTSNSSGELSGTYQASGCVDNDIITATESSTGETASATIAVLAPTIGSIVFDSVTDSLGADIDNIFIQESGGESTARVIFQVLDVFGDPSEDEDVNFELTSTVGGIELQNVTALTDSTGKATAFVNAGFISTSVRVRASIDIDTDDDGIDDTTLVTLSAQLSVNTGIADQNSFTLSASELNFEGLQRNGESITLTAFMADKFNNPVPDGTSISFRTEFGRIDPSCNTSDGNCTVSLNSQEPRAPLDPNTIQQDVVDSSCPSAFIFDENVTISGGAGNTEYQASSIDRVETTSDVVLMETTDYTVDSDGSGITCVSVSCVGTLQITYTREALDEDDSSDTTHFATNPGQATAPYRSRTSIPCLASTSDSGGAVFSGYSGGLGQIFGGRSTILSFAQGEESFVDANGNGIYDYNEPFVDLSEAFHDFNEDGVFGNGTVGVDDSRDTTSRECYGPRSPVTLPGEVLGNCYQIGGDEEEFVDFGDDTTLNNQFDAGNGIYNGTLCPKDISDRTDTCDNNVDPCDEATEQYCTRELVNIRQDGVIIFSGSSFVFSVRDAAYGEYVSSVELTSLDSGILKAGTELTDTDGDAVVAGTDFVVGHDDNEVAPHVGDTVSLTSGTAAVIVNFADINNNPPPAGSTIAVSSGANGCDIASTSSSTVASTNAVGGYSIMIGLAVKETKIGSGDTTTVTVTTPSGVSSSGSFYCQN